MRKHSVRKLLHAILDLLPLFVIPVFALAVRSDNNFQPITIQYDTRVQHINYKYESNEVNTISDLKEGNIYYFNCDNSNLSDYFEYSYVTEETLSLLFVNIDEYDISESNFYEDEVISSNYEIGQILYELKIYNDSLYLNIYSNYNPDSEYFVCYDLGLYTEYELTFKGNCIFNYKTTDFEILDASIFQYTDYNIIDSVTYDGEVVTYDNTDVGSQMIYTLYETVDKYFNFNEVGTFNDMYEWVQKNIFNGSTPLVVPIVWNIVLYEFIMDILFLFYAVFMFIVDFAESMIDRAFYKAHKGCD